MRPMLKPALRPVWRDDETLQLGLDPDRAVVVTGLGPGLSRLLARLTGRHTDDTLAVQAVTDGVDGEQARRLLTLLREAGVVDDADTAATRELAASPVERERWGPDLAARSLHSRGVDGGTAAFAARRHAHVLVHGAGRVGAGVAVLLAAAGIGQVTVVDDRPATHADLSPGGLAPDDVSYMRETGVRRRIRAFTRTTSSRPAQDLPAPARPDLVVLTPDDEVDRGLTADLVRDGLPHLVARVQETRGVVGPLVVPGATSCVRCHDLHRTDRDPRWPTVLAQAAATTPSTPALDVALAAMVTGVAVLHVLGHLEGERPPSRDGTVEFGLPHGAVRRRSWLAHPSCGCQWGHLGAHPGDDDAGSTPTTVRLPPQPGARRTVLRSVGGRGAPTTLVRATYGTETR